ncbi:UNVERIFIED_CONTAM: cell division control protein 14 [Siphonaria sp. JEL0065]|nr:cell division control protein 14 [Siphonaria sp. JEL0065]
MDEIPLVYLTQEGNADVEKPNKHMKSKTNDSGISDGNSIKPLFGINLFSVTNFTTEGMYASMGVSKSGFPVPFGASASVAKGSKWQFQVSTDSSQTWHTMIEATSFPSVITIQQDTIALNATDVFFSVVNSTLLTNIAKLAGQKNAATNAATAGVLLKLSILADVTVAFFQVDGLLLENTFRLADVLKSSTTATSSSAKSGNNSSSSSSPPALISKITTDSVVKITSGMITTGLNLHINNTDPVTFKNLGSPIHFPVFENLSFLGEVNGKQVALMQISKLEMNLADQIVHIPISIANVGGAAFVGKAVGADGSITPWIASKLGSAIMSDGDISLVNWNLGGISGAGGVPDWLAQLFSGFDVVVSAGSGGVFTALLAQALLSFFIEGRDAYAYAFQLNRLDVEMDAAPVVDVFAAAGLPRPTPAHYPVHSDLPWHFSFIDSDAMIGGSSAPTERRHWKALLDHGVGLVVNLTEAAVSPPQKVSKKKDDSHHHEMLLFDFGTEFEDKDGEADGDAGYGGLCSKCGHVDEVYDQDLFADVVGKNMSVLFLPIPDGSVPRFEQLTIFLKEAEKAIKSGKKVIVHCQAGVGRTGTFLAIYLVNKYGFDPLTAITLLRHYRPQSLQFHSTDWQVDPFRLHPDPKAYNRNMVQERFVERWYHALMKGNRRASISASSMIRRGVSPNDEQDGSSTSDSTATTTSHDYSSSPHKNKRRTSFVMDNARLIPDEVESTEKPKSRRRHTDSAATYNNFMDYLVALSKQQHQAKTASLLQPQVSQLPPVSESSSDAIPPSPPNNPSLQINSINNSHNIQSMLSSSLNAMSAYPTPPRTSEMSSSFKRAREAGHDDLFAETNSNNNLNPQFSSSLSPTSAVTPTEGGSLSTSFTDSFSKLSSSSPNHPYTRHTHTHSTHNHHHHQQHSYHHRKRHPKPILHHHNSQQSQLSTSMIPKQSSFTISSILLKLIDQQLDAKFNGFQTSPCTPAPPTHSEKPHTSRVLQVGSLSGLPPSREVSRTMCYGCRGVVSVGPEVIRVHPDKTGSFDGNVAVWPVVVPFPSQEDFVGPSSGSVSPAMGVPSHTNGAVGALLMMSSGAGLSGVNPWAGSFKSAGRLVGDEMELDERAEGGINLPAIVVGSVTSDLNGAVEALQLEEVQRREVSLAVRNRVV